MVRRSFFTAVCAVIVSLALLFAGCGKEKSFSEAGGDEALSVNQLREFRSDLEKGAYGGNLSDAQISAMLIVTKRHINAGDSTNKKRLWAEMNSELQIAKAEAGLKREQETKAKQEAERKQREEAERKRREEERRQQEAQRIPLAFSDWELGKFNDGIRAYVNIENVSSQKIYLSNDFVMRKEGFNAIKASGGDYIRFSKTVTEPRYYDDGHYNLYPGDKIRAQIIFTPDFQKVPSYAGWTMYYEHGGSLTPILNIAE